MIIGITHTAEGAPIQSLEVGLRVAIGLPADEEAGRKAPTKLDHFIFQTKNAKGDWVENKQVTAKIREASGLKPDDPIRKIRVFFTTDDIEEAFRTNLEWWSRSELKCRGNGVLANRSINIVSEELKKKYNGQRYIPWTPCGDSCPDFIRKKDGCKPSGDLTFVLQDLPKLGSMCGFFTTSKRSIAQIFSSLHQVAGPAGLTRGHLKLIPFEMVLKGGKTRYQDAGGASKTGSAFFVNLEMRDTDQDQLLTRLQEHATKFDRMMSEGSRPYLTGGTRAALPPIERISDEDKGKIMTSEFSSDEETEPGENKQPPGEHEEPTPEEVQKASEKGDENEKVFKDFCSAIGLSEVRGNAVLAKLGGDLEAARQFSERFSAAIKVLNLNDEKAMEYLGKGVGGSFDDMFSYFDREIKKKIKADKKTTAAETPAQETAPAAKAEVKEEIPPEMKGW